MKRSENINYIMYGTSLGKGRYRKSLASLIEFIEDCQSSFGTADRLDVVQRLGDAFFHLGDERVAVFFYDIARDIEPQSLRVKNARARFLLHKLREYDAALALCEEVVGVRDDAGASNIEEGDKRQIEVAIEMREEIIYYKNKDAGAE